MPFSSAFDFTLARPVWEKDRQKEMNVSLIFRGFIPEKADAKIRIAASSRYQIFVNGSFFAAGPARAAHGFYRVDEYTLSHLLNEKKNTVAIIAAGYNSNSFYLLDEPSFLCAEIEANGEIIYATGEKDFETTRYNGRLQRVMRYSFQRPFSECYVLDAWYDGFVNGTHDPFKSVPLEECGSKRFITRTVPYCDYNEVKADKLISKGILLPLKTDKVRKYDDRSYTNIGEKLKGFTPEKLEANPVNEMFAYTPNVLENEVLPAGSVELGVNCFSVFEMAKNKTGYIRLSITAQHDTSLYVIFGERLGENGVPEPGADGCVSLVQWSVQGGRSYDLVSFEPYTFKYAAIVSMYAPTLITNLSLYCEEMPERYIVNAPSSKNEKLQKIYNAAVNTFRQCATDIFMDCPSRERAGWLCDSFFTARTERFLTGENRVEDAFLENYLMADKFENIPGGMLPMCYPADHYDGVFIPNWAMWFAIEIFDRLPCPGGKEIAARAENRLRALAEYLEKFENEKGLLEKLESWVFVEWSDANDFTQDINYPTNMLYSAFLDALGKMYDDGSFLAKAEHLREVIREESWNGEFFRDNDVYRDGVLTKTDNISETNQYYAFFFGVAAKERYPELWKRLTEDFGPERKPDVYPEVRPSNVFIGNYLRIQLLLNEGHYDKVENEAKKLFLPMAEQTGTLWEHMKGSASRCHGFASYAAVVLKNAEVHCGK